MPTGFSANTADILFALLRAEICGEAVSEEIKMCLSEEMLERIFVLAEKHDLAHIAGNGLSKLGLLGDNEISKKFKQVSMQAFWRYARLSGEYRKVCKTLEDAKIPFIPLKGAVLREYYPEPWLRTSCDIDILVYEADVQRAIDILSEQLQYRFAKQWFYEYSLFSPNGVHLELHSNTIEKVESGAREAVMETVWERSYPEEGWQYKRRMTDEMFYFYHILHMAKHFARGGCGIRPFLDLWILNHRVEGNRKERYALLEKGELMKFTAVAENLSEVWLHDRAPDSLTCRVAHFVLTGGTYGEGENMVAMRQARKGGKLQYILSRFFPPCDILQISYPVLQKHKWLYPLFLVVRWVRALFGGRCGKTLRDLKDKSEFSQEKIDNAADLLEQLGL